MRLFLAGVVPDALQKSLHAQLESVRVATPQARWVLPEGMHLTLVFLAAVPEQTVPALREAFARVCSRHPPLSLTLSGVETFGPPRSPRVLAVTLGGEVAALQALVGDARQAASPLVPLESDRPFRPHLTVARARSAHGDLLLGRCRTALGHALEGEFVLREASLFHSETRASGAVHTALERWTLHV